VVFLDVPLKEGDKYMAVDRANYMLGNMLLKDLVVNIFKDNQDTNVIALKLPKDYDKNEFMSNDWKSYYYEYKKYMMFVLVRSELIKSVGGDMDDSDQSGLMEQIKNLEDTPDVFKKDDIEYVDDKNKEDDKFKEIVEMSDTKIFNINDNSVSNTVISSNNMGTKKIDLNDNLWRERNPEYREIASDNIMETNGNNIDIDGGKYDGDGFDDDNYKNEMDDDFEIISRKED
jgi:hypothetical protein